MMDKVKEIFGKEALKFGKESLQTSVGYFLASNTRLSLQQFLLPKPLAGCNIVASCICLPSFRYAVRLHKEPAARQLLHPYVCCPLPGQPLSKTASL